MFKVGIPGDYLPPGMKDLISILFPKGARLSVMGPLSIRGRMARILIGSATMLIRKVPGLTVAMGRIVAYIAADEKRCGRKPEGDSN